MDEVASEKLRSKASALITAWFPWIDAFEVESRLGRGRPVLVNDVDSESGKRMVEALWGAKVGATLGPRESKLKSLLNGGLIVSGVALFFSLFGGGLWTFLCLLIALGAPVAGAWSKIKNLDPIVQAPRYSTRSEVWSRLADEYALAVKTLEHQDAMLLRKLVEKAFEVFARLSGSSLVATAAGETEGDLARRLEDAVSSGIEVGRKLTGANEEAKTELRNELRSLAELVDKTNEWLRSRETEDVRDTGALATEIESITQSIDRIIGEVRSPLSADSAKERNLG